MLHKKLQPSAAAFSRLKSRNKELTALKLRSAGNLSLSCLCLCLLCSETVSSDDDDDDGGDFFFFFVVRNNTVGLWRSLVTLVTTF